MPRDGSGNYTRPVNSVSPAVPTTTISSTDFNALTLDIATEMTDSLDRSGKGTMLSGLGMGGFKITNLGVPAVASDAARLDNITTQTSPTINTPHIVTPTITVGGTWAGSPIITSPTLTGATLTGATSIVGGITGSFAAAGNIGEVITAGATVSLTANAPLTTGTNITSVALTVGNWLIFAVFNTGPTANSAGFKVVISAATASLVPVNNAEFTMNLSSGTTLVSPSELRASVGPCVVSIGTPTTYYLNAACNFTSSLNIGGNITAVRLA